MKQSSQKERLLDVITDEWQTSREISLRTGLNSYQVGAVCRRYIKQGLVEFRDVRVRVFGAYRKVRHYRRKRYSVS